MQVVRRWPDDSYIWPRSAGRPGIRVVLGQSGRAPRKFLTRRNFPQMYAHANQQLQMVWRSPLNPSRPFLQVHGCCVYKLTTRDPKTGEVVSVIDDVEEVRRVVYAMQSKIYAAERIYAHRWVEGDLVIFHNRGVMHSITGQLAKKETKRLLWQCTMTSGAPPKPFRDTPGVNATGFVRVEA